MSLLSEAYDLLGVLINADSLTKEFIRGQHTKVYDLMHRIVAAEAEQCEIDCAIDMYGSDNCVMDCDAITNRTDNGRWVEAWVWISDEELAIHDDCEFEELELELEDDNDE